MDNIREFLRVVTEKTSEKRKNGQSDKPTNQQTNKRTEGISKDLHFVGPKKGASLDPVFLTQTNMQRLLTFMFL